MAEHDRTDREVRRLLTVTADRVGRTAAPDPAGLARRAGRRDRAQRTGAVAAVLVAVLAIVVPIGLFAAGRDTTPARPADSAAPAPSPSATAAALAAGRWEDLPPAPIAPRSSPAYAWTGSQLLVWGGYAVGSEGPTRLDDGASYDPATRAWEILPPGPLEAVPNPVSVWTGTQWFILGSTPSTKSIIQQLVSYDPAARTWTEVALPAGRRLPSQVGLTVTAAWTGRELVVVGLESPGGGRGVAAYDPVTASWRDLPELPNPDDESTLARESGAVDGDVVVLSEWDLRGNDGTRSGVSSWRLDPDEGTWTEVGGADPEGLTEPVATRVGLLVPGARGTCGATVSCEPQGGSGGRQLSEEGWAALPESPVENGRGVWTGSALVVADAVTVGPGPVEINAGKAAAYDPTDRTWTALPDAGGPGTEGGVVVWTGQELIVWGSRACGPAAFCLQDPALTGRVLVPALAQPRETATPTTEGDASPSVSTDPDEPTEPTPAVSDVQVALLGPGSSTCTETTLVSRTVTEPATPTSALQALFAQGPTEQESAAGLGTWFSGVTADLLISVRIEDGVAYLNLSDALLGINNLSTSCGIFGSFSQLDQTLAPFGVTDVLLAVEGSPDAATDSLGIACDDPGSPGKRCSPELFRP